MLIAAALSGILFALALPPWSFHWLAWVGLCPLIVACRGVSLRRAIAAGFVFGIVHHWATAYWVLPAMTTYYDQPWWFALSFGVFSSIAYRGTYGALLAAAAWWALRRRNSLASALLVASSWTALEWLRATGPTEDPWLLFGYALTPFERIAQVADLTGVYGLSFLVVLANAALAPILARCEFRLRPVEPSPPPSPFAEAPRDRSRAEHAGEGVHEPSADNAHVIALVVVATTVIGASVGYGAWRLSETKDARQAIEIAVIQGNNDLDSHWEPHQQSVSLATYLRLSLQARAEGAVDLFVWPESAVTFFLARDDAFRRPIERLLEQTGAELIVGAPHLDEQDGRAAPRYFNSAFHVDAAGIVTGRYDKQRLLPFAEYFPLQFGQFLRRNFGRLRQFSRGADPSTLATAFGNAGVAICFEAIFPEFVRQRARDSDFLLNLSNDMWFGDGAGVDQHAAMVPLRAIETRSWLIRSTTTGVSSVTDPYGRTLAAAPRGAEAILRATIKPSRTTTAYEQAGDWFPMFCGLIAACFALCGAALTMGPRVRHFGK